MFKNVRFQKICYCVYIQIYMLIAVSPLYTNPQRCEYSCPVNKNCLNEQNKCIFKILQLIISKLIQILTGITCYIHNHLPPLNLLWTTGHYIQIFVQSYILLNSRLRQILIWQWARRKAEPRRVCYYLKKKNKQINNHTHPSNS